MRRWVTAIWMVLVTVGAAGAHSWYDPMCCDNKDCEPIAAGLVSTVPTGWYVGGEFNVFIPRTHKDLRVSEDSQYHICRWPSKHFVRCFYVPSGGV